MNVDNTQIELAIPWACADSTLRCPISLWLFGSLWMMCGTLVLVWVLYELDRRA